jgi:hypothetical protein
MNKLNFLLVLTIFINVLYLTGCDNSEGTLSPDFSPGITTYTAEVGNEVNSISLRPIPNDVNADD